jgi:hypothetical protein
MSPRTLSEVDAMKIVDETLGALGEEERKRVLAWARSKFQAAADDGEDDSQIVRKAAKTQGSAAVGSIKDFVELKQPASLYERVACLAYYLEKVESVTEFKSIDIEKANTAARQGKIDDVTMVLADATRKHGFFVPAGKGRKSLASRGEKLVEALPDREAVKKLKAPRRKAPKARKATP